MEWLDLLDFGASLINEYQRVQEKVSIPQAPRRSQVSKWVPLEVGKWQA